MPDAFIFILVALAGALTDFLFSGVFKIIWMVICIPAYVTCALTIETYILKRPHLEKYSIKVPAAFMIGALLIHFLFMENERTLSYSMFLKSNSPTTLASNDFPQVLFISGDQLTASLASFSPHAPVSVTATEILDYGCVRKFAFSTVNGIDVKTDKNINWTLRTEAGIDGSGLGPGSEDNWMPWCKISFYGIRK